MLTKKTILSAALATTLLGLGAAAHAQYNAVVTIAPPAPQYEVAPPPRQGQVWAPGHYEWRGNQYVWVQGHWLAARSGYDYREPRWVQRGNGEWVQVGGNWERRGPYGDRDRDGIPNHADNRNTDYNNRISPYGDLDRDGIYNRDDRDRDGDGIRNNRDRYPDDRRRG